MASPIAIPGPIPSGYNNPLDNAKFRVDNAGGSLDTTPATSEAGSSPGNSYPEAGSSPGTSYPEAGSSPSYSGEPTFFGNPSSLKKKKSVVMTGNTSPPSPSTVKRLLRIRKMSEMSRTADSGNIQTIPTQPSDINISWAKLLINQHRIKHFQPPLPANSTINRFCVKDCKTSSGDLSTTCRISVDTEAKGVTTNYVFIAKLLPADDPCRVYVFEQNVFEKEISIYFELLPCLRQFCEGTKLSGAMLHRVPQCIYGSNNCDGAGVLVFECAQELGFRHPVNPEGLSLDQVMCTVEFMAKFHAIGSALLITKGKLLTLRYPFISTNVYSSPLMQEGAKRLFHIYTEFLQSVSGEAELHHKFTKYCNEECAAKEMFTCLRRQVDSPFNTIIHGELWEKSMLFGEVVDAEGTKELQSIILDWKNAKIASATKDLAFLLLSSTTNELRTESLDHILTTYHNIFTRSLESLGVNTGECQGLSYEDFFADYAMSTKGAFLQSVCVLVQEMSFMENQLHTEEGTTHARNLTAYESRALNIINDDILNQTHFL